MVTSVFIKMNKHSQSSNDQVIEKIKALFSCEGVDFNDVDAALKSLSETCLPTKLTRVYLMEVNSGRF